MKQPPEQTWYWANFKIKSGAFRFNEEGWFSIYKCSERYFRNVPKLDRRRRGRCIRRYICQALLFQLANHRLMQRLKKAMSVTKVGVKYYPPLRAHCTPYLYFMNYEHKEQSAGQYWCFTLNNHTVNDEELILALVKPGFGGTDSFATYVCMGREQGASGTPHLQGYIEFRARTRFTLAKRLLGGRVHLEKRKGNAAQAAAYCKKDADFEEVCSYTPRYGQLCLCSLVNQRLIHY